MVNRLSNEKIKNIKHKWKKYLRSRRQAYKKAMKSKRQSRIHGRSLTRE